VLAVTGLALLVAAGLFATCTPSFRARATLLLEADRPGGLFGDLAVVAALSSAPAASSEISVLRSQTLAEEVVTNLGLTTRVSDEGLSAVAEAPPDLILLDLVMPGRSGFDLLSEVTEADGAPPVIVLRSDVQRAPEDPEEQRELFGRLLELNATEVVHGAYGLENGQILLSDTLELADLDFSEFQASIESIALALSSYKQNLETD